MKKNGFLISVIVVLVLGVGALGFEVVKLKREVTGLAGVPWISPFSMPQIRHSFSQAFPWWEREPFYELGRIQNEINKIFKDSFRRGLGSRDFGFFSKSNIFNPEIDMKESPTQYIVRADLPGMEKEQIDIEVTDHTLSISGEKDEETEINKGHRFFRKERSVGSFASIITLPEDAQTDSINADYKRGVLTIMIPKATTNKEKVSSNKIIVQ